MCFSLPVTFIRGFLIGPILHCPLLLHALCHHLPYFFPISIIPSEIASIPQSVLDSFLNGLLNLNKVWEIFFALPQPGVLSFDKAFVERVSLNVATVLDGLWQPHNDLVSVLVSSPSWH